MQEIFTIIILIMSVVIHEVSHGYAALFFGDQTAKFEGRLTLNPIKHLDPIGSVLIPLLLIISHAGFIFGWARPVPYNPNNLRNKKNGTIAVASAGILANLFIALIFGILIRIVSSLGIGSEAFFIVSELIVLINLLLAIFNLIPIPPLDGSKILFSFISYKYQNIITIMERYSIIILVIFIFFIFPTFGIWSYIQKLISLLFNLFTGTML